MSVPDYLANRTVEEGDKLDYGVAGMKWGIRKDRATLRAEAAKRATTESKPSGEASQKKTSSGVESPAEKYARLGAAARAGKAQGLSDEDLKWYNARTDALARINKLNQKDPSWLKKTTDEVLKNVAKNTLQQVVQNAANAKVVAPLDPAKKNK